MALLTVPCPSASQLSIYPSGEMERDDFCRAGTSISFIHNHPMRSLRSSWISKRDSVSILSPKQAQRPEFALICVHRADGGCMCLVVLVHAAVSLDL